MKTHRPKNKTPHPKQWLTQALLRKNLAWLPGIPIPTPENTRRWLRLSSCSSRQPNYWTITPELLAQAKVAVRHLRSTEQQSQLRRVCRHPSAWLDRLSTLLQIISREQPLDRPLELAHHFGRRWQAEFESWWLRHPALRSTLRSIAMYQLSQPQPSLSLIRRAEIFLPKLLKLRAGEQNLRISVLLCLLAEDISEDWASFILDFFSLPVDLQIHSASRCNQTFKQAMEHARACGQSLRHHSPLPPHSLRRTLPDFLERLALQPAETRRKVTQLLGHLSGSEIAKSLTQAEQANLELHKKLKREAQEREALGTAAYVGSRTHEFFNQFVLPERHSLPDTIRSLHKLEKAIWLCWNLRDQHAWQRSAIRLFEKLSALRWEQRVSLFNAWMTSNRHWHPLENRCRDIEPVFRRLASLISQQGISDWLIEDWQTLFESEKFYPNDLVMTLLTDSLSNEAWTRAQYLLKHWSDRAEVRKSSDRIWLHSVGKIAQASSTVSEARSLLHHCRCLPRDVEVEADEIRMVQSITPAPAEQATLLQKLSNLNIAGYLRDIAPSTTTPQPLLAHIEHLIRQGQEAELKRLSLQMRTLRSLGCKIPKPSISGGENRNWFLRYPKALHTDLQRLADGCPGAERAASNLLATHFPTEAALSQEVLQLEKILQQRRHPLHKQAWLETRLLNLRCRLESPRSCSPARLQNLREKLSKRASLEYGLQFSQAYERTVRQRFLRSHPQASLSPRLFQSPYNILLLAVAELRGKSRDIGFRLLLSADEQLKNAQPLAPENQAFLNSVESRSIDIRPWLRASHSQEIRVAQERYTLGFATDPLELMLMGFHFDTCLSPASFNFFSAVTNAIDVNKQVLYCRRSNGTVVGRCLFGLTNSGQIQTFHRYCHDNTLEFDCIVDDFALRLAQEMGTALTSQGALSPLVAGKWYDDGPTTGGLHRIQDCSGDSEIGQTLTLIPAAEALEHLTELLGSRETVELNLPNILEHPVFSTRLDISVFLATQFVESQRVPPLGLFRLALLARRAKQHGLVQRLLRRLDRKRIAQQLEQVFDRTSQRLLIKAHEAEILDLLIEFDVQVARRFLRLSRHHRVHSDQQETDPVRRQALARIHRRSGRFQIADQLLVAAKGSSE